MKPSWGIALLFVVGCAVSENTDTDTSNVTTQWENEYRYNNVALNGTATSSGAYSVFTAASRINDGHRATPSNDE